MANLTEASQWEAGIYQLETSDPVEGGPDGIDNVQARQLGNRTRFLKDSFDAHTAADNPHPQYATIVQLQASLNALVAAAPGALDTLNELATALGNDPNFATTMTNALALKAALDSPIFTGTPQGPTPPQFDASKRFATMEALQKALGNDSPSFWNSIAVSQTIAPSKAGNFVNVTAPGTTQTIDVTNMPAGSRFTFAANYTTGSATTITSNNANLLFNAPGYSNTASFTINAGEVVKVVFSGNGFMIDGGSALGRMTPDMACYLSDSGYHKLPSGMIFQWGVALFSTTGSSVIFPIEFPNQPFVVLTGNNESTNTFSVALNLSKSGFLALKNSGSAAYNYFIAFGY